LPLCGMAQPNNPQTTPAKPPGAAMTPAIPAPAVMPEKGRLSYAIGMYFGNNITNSFKRGGVDLDTNDVLDAIKDVVTGKPTRLTEAEQGEVMKQLRAALQAKQQVQAEEAKGNVKEAVGKVVGNKDLEVKGNIQKNVGAVQASLGDVKEDVKKVLKSS